MTKQSQHFDWLFEKYCQEYGDKGSMHYKRELILKQIVSLLKLRYNGKCSILDVACGPGENSVHLAKLLPNASFTGIDISSQNISAYEALMGSSNAIVCDFTQEINFIQKFDVVLVLGGLHHMVDGLPQVFDNISELLNDQGLLIFVEPNKRFMDPIRRLWYRFDKSFNEEEESALDERELYNDFGVNRFLKQSATYFGSIGFFLILQSMILRTPRIVKKVLYKPLTKFDKAVRFLPDGFLAAYICVWVKT